MIKRISLLFLLIALPWMSVSALEQPATVQQSSERQPSPIQPLVPFASQEGLTRLSRSDARVDFPELANQFEAQSNGIFCGPTTVAIVLNTLYQHQSNLPREKSRLNQADYQYLPTNFDPTVPRFTQESVIAKGRKTRAQVFGEPMAFNGKLVTDFGYQLRQLNQMIQANGAKTEMHVVTDDMPAAEIRQALVKNLKHKGDYVIVAYKRSAVGQKGGGHISPVAAYDTRSDSFLVMDVNPAKAGWVWMSTKTLIHGMRTLDTIENRGYILVNTH
jgi:hypothetical protein